jgi:hypothetical protein
MCLLNIYTIIDQYKIYNIQFKSYEYLYIIYRNFSPKIVRYC